LQAWLSDEITKKSWTYWRWREEEKENEECSDSLQQKRLRRDRQLKSFWNNRSLEDLLIFKQGGRKTAGSRNFHFCGPPPVPFSAIYNRSLADLIQGEGVSIPLSMIRNNSWTTFLRDSDEAPRLFGETLISTRLFSGPAGFAVITVGTASRIPSAL
jgi:hypothetical protein